MPKYPLTHKVRSTHWEYSCTCSTLNMEEFISLMLGYQWEESRLTNGDTKLFDQVEVNDLVKTLRKPADWRNIILLEQHCLGPSSWCGIHSVLWERVSRSNTSGLIKHKEMLSKADEKKFSLDCSKGNAVSYLCPSVRNTQLWSPE